MTSAWYVIVSSPGKIYLAAHELHSIGAEVFVPEEREICTYTRKEEVGVDRSGRARFKDVTKRVITTKPLIDPYFYAFFDASREAELNAVMGCRGVEDVLGHWEGERRVPQWISNQDVADARAAYFQSMGGITERAKYGRDDLVLKDRYRILRYHREQFVEKTGILMKFGRGFAHLDVDKCLISLPDGDIAPVVSPVVPARRAA